MEQKLEHKIFDCNPTLWKFNNFAQLFAAQNDNVLYGQLFGNHRINASDVIRGQNRKNVDFEANLCLKSRKKKTRVIFAVNDENPEIAQFPVPLTKISYPYSIQHLASKFQNVKTNLNYPKGLDT